MPRGPTSFDDPDAEVVAWWPDDRPSRRAMAVAPRHAPPPEDDPEAWLRAEFPRSVTHPFAPRMQAFWRWVWAIAEDSDPPPFLGIWPRGGGKTSSAELAVAALGLRGKRRYALYVRATQPRADDCVQNIASLLESPSVDRDYPAHASRAVGKYGDVRGWRRNRLRTAGGFVVDALGLDVATRGVKVEDQRPDLIVLDDVDDRHDTPQATEKKLTILRDSILPAGTDRCAVIAIQNLIIAYGVFAQLADGRAGFLTRRVLSGPEPALVGMRTTTTIDATSGLARAVIVAGTPTWAGQDRAACQRLLDRIGTASFERECQHNVAKREGALWAPEAIERNRVAKAAPRFKRIAIGVDPSGGRVEIGIIAAGLRYDGHVEVLADATQPGPKGPRNWARVAIGLYRDLKADVIDAEANFGGEMVRATIHAVDPNVNVRLVHASRGKEVRAEPVAAKYGDEKLAYRDGRVHHVGTLARLEQELTGWVPGDPISPNRLDALVWTVAELLPDLPARDEDFDDVPVMQH